HGSADGQFQRPAGVAVDADGKVYVTDHFNDRVERFSADGRFEAALGQAMAAAAPLASATPLATPAAPTPTPNASATPSAIADTGNGRVQRLAPDGTLEASWLLPLPLAPATPTVPAATPTP